MKKFTRISSVVIALVLILSLISGCGSSSNGTENDKTDSTVVQDSSTVQDEKAGVSWDKNKKDKVVISVINNFYTAGEKKLAKDYMALHPETEVVVDVVADNDTYLQNLKTKISTDKNTAPDIIHSNFAKATFGSWTVCYEKGYLLDMQPILDEVNVYNDNKKVREAFEEKDIAQAISEAEGKLDFMPFDKLGVGVFYNKTVFDKYGLKVPSSIEEWLDVCKKLEEEGFHAPVSSAWVSQFIPVALGDIAYRPIETSLLSLPGDAAYDEKTMKLNVDIKYDPNDANFDQYAIVNDEKVKAFEKKGFNNPINKQIWSTFADIGQYFQKNWTNPDDQKVVTDFENQISPMMLHGSWNVGSLVADIKKMPADKQFDWGVFAIPGYANPPAGFEAKIRGFYIFGNEMGIIPKDDKDHMERVKDVYKYWYSPKQAQMMYDETLSNGNLVQGPPIIKGVTLSQENASKLDGFKSDGCQRSILGEISGRRDVLAADKPKSDALSINLTEHKISIDEFMVEMDKLLNKRLDDDIKKAGYDLDPATKDTPQK